MEFISHRVNTIEELSRLPNDHGAEIDLRDYGENIVIQHDPFVSGEDFEKYLRQYNHGTMILNIKSERIEYNVLKLLKKYKINKYFFLDCSFPMINSLSNSGEKNIALRFSEFEGIDTIINMKNKVNWIWVDCFSKFPLSIDNFYLLKSLGYKLCLVSPELQGHSKNIQEKLIEKMKLIPFDAICTKNSKKWKKILN